MAEVRASNTSGVFVLVYKVQNDADRNEDGSCVMESSLISSFLLYLEETNCLVF